MHVIKSVAAMRQVTPTVWNDVKKLLFMSKENPSYVGYLSTPMLIVPLHLFQLLMNKLIDIGIPHCV